MKRRTTQARTVSILAALLALALLVGACGAQPTPAPVPTTAPAAAAPVPTTAPAAPAPEPTTAPEVKPTEAPKVDMGSLVFFSTQFVPVEEAGEIPGHPERWRL